MTFSLDRLTRAYPDQLWLEFSQEEQEKAWPDERDYSHDAARWRAYLNRLCLNILVPALQQEEPLKNLPQVWPNPATLPSIWEVLNGTAITLGAHRIVIIPDTSIDTEEFCVPAEWVDIPSFAADYYLAVQVNERDGWLRVWGFTTHQKLKHQGEYDPQDRTYSLSPEDLFEDLNVLWVAKEHCLESKAEIQPLPQLSHTQAQRLLALLGQPSRYSPRLLVGFAEWAALLEHGDWRQRLYQQRQEIDEVTSKPLVRLSQWLKQQFEAGWQSVESLLDTQTVELTFSFRELPATTAERAKLIDLDCQPIVQVILLVKIVPISADKMRITVGVRPKGQTHLPEQLQLAVLDAGGAVAMEARANSANQNIQLQFSGEPEENFSVKVTLGDVSVVENLAI